MTTVTEIEPTDEPVTESVVEEESADTKAESPKKEKEFSLGFYNIVHLPTKQVVDTGMFNPRNCDEEYLLAVFYDEEGITNEDEMKEYKCYTQM